MEEIREGGPGIPILEVEYEFSIRDYFAGLAMQSLISKIPIVDREGKFSEKFSQDEIDKIQKEITESSYNYADKMLKARKL